MDGLGVRIMILKMAEKKNRALLKFLTMVGLGLAFCAGALPASAQQNQPGEVQATGAPQDSQGQGQPDSPPQQQPDSQFQGQPDSQAPADADIARRDRCSSAYRRMALDRS